ncbi:MAG: diguanylate cyclase [Magnetococcales bacterium]|nr:diguanylate cyclase [Magnetococcales bacterium]
MILLSLIPAIVLTSILFFIWHLKKTRYALPTQGVALIITGLVLLLLGNTLSAISQQTPLLINELLNVISINAINSLGFLILGFGIYRWMPTVTSLEKVERFSQELVDSYSRLEIYNSKLQEERELSQSVSHTAHDAIISIDENGVISLWNSGATKTFGYKPEEIIGQPLLKIIPKRFQQQHISGIGRVNSTGKSRVIGSVMEMDGLHKDGHEIPLEISLATWFQDGNRYYAAVMRNITERKKSEKGNERIQQSRIAISSLLKIALEPIKLEELLEKALSIILSVPWLSLQSKGSIFLMNDETNELVLVAQKGLAPHLLTACARIPIGYCLCGRAAQEKKLIYSEHMDHRHDVTFDGIKPHGHYCVPVMFQDKLLGVVNSYIPDGHERNHEETEFLQAMANTIAGLIERKRMEQRLEHIAHHDSLTGLPNRLLFLEHVTKQIARSRRDKTLLALLFMDLDHFKQVNDTMGHNIGDLLLIEASTRVKSCLRDSDMIARLGGDEFTISLPVVAKPEDAGLVAQKIIEELSRPFFLNSQECNIGSSIGISMFPFDGDSPELLLKKADIAMYDVKQHGRNSSKFFKKGMAEGRD